MAHQKVSNIKELDKKKQLEGALDQIERQFGSGTVMRMGDKKQEKIPSISTGSLGLDIALGIGGLPKGRVVEIYGPESSGKTTLSLEVIAQCQKAGGTAAFIDAEHALDPIYAQKVGVKVEELLISQPDTGEQALEVADIMVHSGGIDVLVIDSVAALVPKAEIEGEMGDHHVGLQARLMSQALRKITGNVKRSNTLVIFINQIRYKIGVMFGSPETTSGGNALKFYASVRMDIRRIGTVKKGDEAVGNETRVKVVKNKVSPPFRQAEFQIIYNKGINRLGELIDLCSDLGIVEKSGAWYSFEGERIGQGKSNVVEFLEENPKFLKEASNTFGSSTIVVAIEAIRQNDGSYLSYTDNGREYTGMEVQAWAKEVEERGAGEILLTSIDQEGTRKGLDTELAREVCNRVNLPVVISGGVGTVEHVTKMCKDVCVDGVALASVLHYEQLTVETLKANLLQAGIEVRS